MPANKEKEKESKPILWVITVVLLALAAWMYFRR
jgi:hypothetical protein